MAKPQEQLQPIALPYEYTNPNIRQCPCGCGPIIKGEHEYIESKANGKWYGYLSCLIDAEKWKHSADYSRILMDDGWKTQKEVREIYEVVNHFD